MNDDVFYYFIDALYKGLLGREPDPEGMNAWKLELQRTKDFNYVFEQFKSSEEFTKVSKKYNREVPNKFITEIIESIGHKLNVIDIGSLELSYEQPIWMKLSKYLDLKVIGFDPQITTSKSFLTPLEETNQIELYNYGFALGDGSQRELYINNDTATSSMYQIIENSPFTHLNSLKISRIEKVKTYKLDDLSTPEMIDLLKIDVQGFELEILRNGITTLEKSGLVIVEIEYREIYQNQPLFADVDIFMRKNNFELVDISNKKYSYDLYSEYSGDDVLMWGDAIYRKRTTNAHTLSSQALLLGILFNKWNIAEYLWKLIGNMNSDLDD